MYRSKRSRDHRGLALRMRFGDGPSGADGPFGGRGRHRHGFGHGGGGGAYGGRRFTGDALRLMVLGLLRDEPQHGYQLIRAFAERSAEAYAPSPGMLYPLLTMLADVGLIEETDRDGGKRRSYRITEAGLAELTAREAELDAAFAHLAHLSEQANRTDKGPVRRAMLNLRSAMVQRLGGDGRDSELVFEVAAILDEAAQKIERLQSERPQP